MYVESKYLSQTLYISLAMLTVGCNIL